MRLVEVELEPAKETVPADVAALLADAQVRLAQFDARFQASIPGFVPCDFEQVYHALAQVQSRQLAAGQRFIEWGSGIGVVACLAAMLDFDAVGIEIEPPLVEIAESLAADHGIAVQFACGSYVPDGAEPFVDTAGDVTWLRTDRPSSYIDLDLEPEDFDIVFAYPWPGEEQLIFDLFTRCAATGSLLLTYLGQDGLRLQRKVRR